MVVKSCLSPSPAMKQSPSQSTQQRPFLRLRAAFLRGNSESSFDVTTNIKKPPPKPSLPQVTFRLDLNTEHEDTDTTGVCSRSPEELAACFYTTDDYVWFARDSALCVESYRQTTLQQNKEWTDDDGVSSIHGLHDLLRPKSAAETRRAHARTVLQAQAKLLPAKRDNDDNDVAVRQETLRKVSMGSSKECVQQAIQWARDCDAPSSFSLTRLFANKK